MIPTGQTPEFELAAVLQNHRDQLTEIVPNTWKQRCLFALLRCRTAEMGGHIDQCDHPNCHRLHLSYNSCRNRHCPKCQGQRSQQWIAARTDDLLNCTYYHVVYTLPECLNELAVRQPEKLYNALFKAAWKTIQGFADNPRFLGARPGMIAVLHTWGQNLSLHPHLHCIVPAGGMTVSGKWKTTRSKGRFLFPVKAMSKVFRAKFTEILGKQMDIPSTTRKAMFAKPWVVYAKRPFFGPRQVIEYLGRYTHKIAISNHRIKNIANGRVWFAVKDYKQGGKNKIISLPEQEFIRRFSLHILPKGYTRIRHYGILSSMKKKECKKAINQQIGYVVLKEKQAPVVSQHRLCPFCKIGRLITLLTFDKRGPPAHYLQRLQQDTSKA